MARTVNGTDYTDETPAPVVAILEKFRLLRPRARLVLYYGDKETGTAWGDKEAGYIGRSTGSSKIPIILPNARSMGGPGVLDACIVRIETAQGKRLLWQHASFNAPAECFACNAPRPEISKPCPACGIR